MEHVVWDVDVDDDDDDDGFEGEGEGEEEDVKEEDRFVVSKCTTDECKRDSPTVKSLGIGTVVCDVCINNGLEEEEEEEEEQSVGSVEQIELGFRKIMTGEDEQFKSIKRDCSL